MRALARMYIAPQKIFSFRLRRNNGRDVLEGGARNPYRDCLLLGAALALEVAGAEDAPSSARARASRSSRTPAT